MSEVTQLHREANNKHNLVGKKVLIVGGSQGIGYGVAVALVKRGSSVVIASKNEKNGQESVSKLRSIANNNASIDFKQVDLASIADVKRFTSDFPNENFDHIVWSAGIFPYGERQETIDGIEKAFAIDYVARFVGINLLLPKLKKGGRVLSVLCPYHEQSHGKFREQFDIDDLEGKKEGRWQSHKFYLINVNLFIANDVFIHAIAKKHPEFTFLHQQPGYIRTNLFVNSQIPEKNELDKIFGDLSKYSPREPEDYGETAIYLLTEPSVAEYSGRGIKQDGTAYDDNEFIQDDKYMEKILAYSTKISGVECK
jgi:hypothetical protein